MRSKRILVLFGGVELLGSERANIEVIEALIGQGFDVRMMVSGGWWAEDMRAHLRLRGIPFTSVPFLLVYQQKHWTGVISNLMRVCLGSILLLIELIRFRPGTIFCGTQLAVLNFLPALLLAPVELVYRCGDKPVLHNWLFRGSWRFIRHRSRRIVAVSEFIRLVLIRHGCDPLRVQVIYSRPPRRDQAVTDFSARIDDSMFVIGYVGQLRAQKGVGVLCDAVGDLLKQYDKVRLLIAGRLSEWAGDAWGVALAREVQADPVRRDRISFLGYVDNVPALLAACDVVVVPTLTEEPLANVVLEAKQAGVPSVVFRSGGLPEVVEAGVDGFICDKKDSDSLAATLERYLQDPALAPAQGRAARASLARFRINEFESSWAQVFEGAET